MQSIVLALAVQGVDPDKLQVVRFEGEERLTRPYRFDLDVISPEQDLPLDSFLGKTATFKLSRHEETRQIHGIIMEAAESGEAPGGVYAYRLTLVPRVSVLALSKHNRSFATQSHMSVLEVIQSVLSDPNGLAFSQEDWSFEIRQQESYPPRDFWAQYDETDFDFVHRLLEHWGLFYYFEQGESHERIVFSDTTVLAPKQQIDGTLPFDSRNHHTVNETGIVQSVSRRMRMVTKSVHLKDYNDQTPHIPVLAQADVPSGHAGAFYEYAPHILDNGEGQILAKTRAEEIGSTRDVFDITSDSPFLTPGAVFDVSDHFRSSLNQGYFPTAIRHTGIQNVANALWDETAKSKPGYHNTITAVPSSSAYRSPRVIRRPVMSGVMPATVEATTGHGSRAVLDSQGRYKVAIDFDTAENPVYQQSSFLRMTQPYSGPNMGMHFPLLEGTEVMVGWVDGDPDRPLIVGAVPNAKTASPVTKANQTENKIRTPSGIAMIMNDGPGQSTQSSAGTATAAQTTAAPVASTGTSGIYSAFKIPAASGGQPHYFRLGDIAPADGYEQSIVGSTAFQADNGRSPTLSDAAYSGIFAFTPEHYTLSVGGNSNTVVQGTQQTQVNGNTTHVAYGSTHYSAFLSPAKSAVGASSLDQLQKFEVSCELYTLESFVLPRFEYFNSEKIEFSNFIAVDYGMGMKLSSLQNVAGTFEHRLGAQVTLSGLPGMFEEDNKKTFKPPAGSTIPMLGGSGAMNPGSKPYGSSYNLSTSGYSYKQISGVDSDHRIFAKSSIAIGFRPVVGGSTMETLTGVAKNATALSTASAVANELLQVLSYVPGEVPSAGEEDAYFALQQATTIGLGLSYLMSLAAILTYHLIVAKDALAPHAVASVADPLASTMSMATTGLMLQSGNAAVGSTVSLSPSLGIQIFTGVDSSILISAEIIGVTSPTISITGSDAVTISATSVTISAASIKLDGAVTVTGNLSVNGAISSDVTVTAPVSEFG